MTTNKMTVSLGELVKKTTTNLSVLMTLENQVIEEEALAAQKVSSKIRKLINKRSSLIGLSGMEARIQELTNQINALRV